MEIRLDRIHEEPLQWEEAQAVAASTLARAELLDLGEIHWGGRITRVNPGYRFQADLDYLQTLACTRCLDPIRESVKTSVDLLVEVRNEVPTPGERELTSDELGAVTVDEPILDTNPILMEQLHLNIPAKALCRADCAGLCPVCGADRNRNRCSCETTSPDPRWAPLAALRREGSK